MSKFEFKKRQYRPRHERLGVNDCLDLDRIKPSVTYSRNLDGSFVSTPNSDIMDLSDFNKWKLDLLVEAGVELKPTPLTRGSSELDLLSQGEAIAKRIVNVTESAKEQIGEE